MHLFNLLPCPTYNSISSYKYAMSYDLVVPDLENRWPGATIPAKVDKQNLQSAGSLRHVSGHGVLTIHVNKSFD